MDDVARLSDTDRADLFSAAAAGRGLAAVIVEKDFWVCWTLKRIFTLPDPPADILFKGGTSLSKVYNANERFSEDVDLSFDRAGLGFSAGNDPMNAASGKKRRSGLDDLKAVCRQKLIREVFLPRLAGAFADALRSDPGPDRWGLALADDDPDRQTLLFEYPRATRPGDEPSYVRSAVRLELGARSDHWPTIDAVVRPYAAEDFPKAFREHGVAVRALAGERTFWEKATILHGWCNAPADKKLQDRQSRHYYDLVRLFEHDVGKAALKDTDLLIKVAGHKEAFFPAAWAKYAEARPGSLRLVPPSSRIPELVRDYGTMREMFFGEPPPFDEILRKLAEIEQIVNAPPSEPPSARTGV